MSLLRDALLREIDEALAYQYGCNGLTPRMAVIHLRTLGFWLTGKRVPPQVRSHPLVRRLVGWWRWFECNYGNPDVELYHFMRDDSQDLEEAIYAGLVRTLPDLRRVVEEHMPIDEDDYRLPPGQIGRESRGGGQVIATVAIPEAALDELQALLNRINGERIVPTLEMVRATCAELTDQMIAVGVRRLWVYGSVARGTAHGGSDVDLVLETVDRERRYMAEGEVQALLEDRLERLVDVWPGDERVAAGKKAVLVWEVTS